MRIVHFSDWHGDAFDLPPGDLYACTGDMLPNFRIFDVDLKDGGKAEWEDNLDLLGETLRPQPAGPFVKRPPDSAREAHLQTRYLAHKGHGHLRARFGTPGAPVACCRGNHDFVGIAPLFAGGPVFEIGEDPERVWEILGLRIGGVRGVKRHRGRWSDELDAAEFDDRARRLPSDLDVLVTHAPPEGILDEIPGESIGSPALRAYVARHDPSLPPLRAHLYGHVHEAKGKVAFGGTVFSNASRGWNVIDI